VPSSIFSRARFTSSSPWPNCWVSVASTSRSNGYWLSIFDTLPEPLGARVAEHLAALHPQAAFGSQDFLFSAALYLGLQGLADYPLERPEPVGLGGVEEVYAEVQSAAHGAHEVLLLVGAQSPLNCQVPKHTLETSRAVCPNRV
jgi:hypothetical protein